MLRSDVALLDASQLGPPEALAQLDEGDVVVVASCAPHTRSIAANAVAAATFGLAAVAVTDTRASPLLAPSWPAFLIPHPHRKRDVMGKHLLCRVSPRGRTHI